MQNVFDLVIRNHVFFFNFQCESLEDELSEKVQLLSSSNSRAAGLEADQSELSTTVQSLQKTIKEKELKISSLEQKNEKLIEEHETETENLQHQLNMLQTKMLEKEVRVLCCVYVYMHTCCIIYNYGVITEMMCLH